MKTRKKMSSSEHERAAKFTAYFSMLVVSIVKEQYEDTEWWTNELAKLGCRVSFDSLEHLRRDEVEAGR